MSKLSPDDLVDAFKDMTLLEVADFVKKFERTFDVSAAAPVTTIEPIVETEPIEAQTEFNVTLEAAGDKKIGVIKVVRELVRGLGLKESKDLVDAAPTPVLQMVTRDVADDAKAKLEAVGATVTVT